MNPSESEKNGVKESEVKFGSEDTGNVQVLDNPKEIKILGNFDRVYVEGNELHQKFVFEKAEPKATQKPHKCKNKRYIIIPIKDENSVVQFIKVPLCKLPKKPESTYFGTVNCPRFNLSDEMPIVKTLEKRCAVKDEFYRMVEMDQNKPPKRSLEDGGKVNDSQGGNPQQNS